MKPQITVTATVYRPRGEKSNARLRAAVAAGPYAGLKVSCPRYIRDAWQPGQRITATGTVVYAGSQSAYFKAREVQS